MAVLDSTDQTAIQRAFMGALPGSTALTKPNLVAAAQACEDVLTNNAAAIASAINAATSPVVLSATEKRLIFAAVAVRKARRDGVAGG